eukprot:4708189-Alexandrium_andersonii.AAC.1
MCIRDRGGEQSAGAREGRTEGGPGGSSTVDLCVQDEFSEVTTVTGVKRPLRAAAEELGAEPLASWPAGRPSCRDMDGEDGGLGFYEEDDGDLEMDGAEGQPMESVGGGKRVRTAQGAARGDAGAM